MAPKDQKRQHIGNVALVVRDYDEAIDYFTKILGFDLIEDTRLSGTKRWVMVAPPGSNETRLLLAKAATQEQTAHIGNPNRRASLLVSPHRRLRARLCAIERARREFRRDTQRRTVRYCRGV